MFYLNHFAHIYINFLVETFRRHTRGTLGIFPPLLSCLPRFALNFYAACAQTVGVSQKWLYIMSAFLWNLWLAYVCGCVCPQWPAAACST